MLPEQLYCALKGKIKWLWPFRLIDILKWTKAWYLIRMPCPSGKQAGHEWISVFCSFGEWVAAAAACSGTQQLVLVRPGVCKLMWCRLNSREEGGRSEYQAGLQERKKKWVTSSWNNCRNVTPEWNCSCDFNHEVWINPCCQWKPSVSICVYMPQMPRFSQQVWKSSTYMCLSFLTQCS